MNNKRTITTREQIKINGEIHERTATHIVTGAHGYETLCISGYIVEHNEMGEVIHNSEKLAEDLLPVTCYLLPARHAGSFGITPMNLHSMILTVFQEKGILL